MPIPALTTAGLLPAGVYLATLPEIEQQFGSSNARRIALFASLQTFVALAQSFQLFSSLIVDGSFVTDKPVPGDIDVVLVIPGARRGALAIHPDRRRILDSERIKRELAIHLFIQPPPNGMAEFFQLLRPDEAIRRGVQPDHRRGILEVSL